MPFTEVTKTADLVDISTIKSKDDVVNLIKEMDLQIGEIPQNFGFFHGLEDISLYDRATNRLFQRQWFTRSAHIARDYAQYTQTTFECFTIQPLRVVRIPQREILYSAQFGRFVKEIISTGHRVSMISKWDVELVRYKRWYLLDIIKDALQDTGIKGWIDNPPEELEIYLCDVENGLQITQRRLNGNEQPLGDDLTW